MKKINGIKIIIKFVLVCFAVGCTQETELPQPEGHLAHFTVKEARMWFDANLQPMLQAHSQAITKSGEAGMPSLIPFFDWSKAITGFNKDWSVVELPWEHKNGKVVFSIDGAGNNEPDLSADSLQLVRLVMAKNLNTNDVYAFKMVVLPDPQYLEQGGYLPENQYLQMQYDFWGLVLFYDVFGEFVVGYTYEQGRIVNKLTTSATPEKGSEAVIRPKSGGWVEITTCWWQLTFSGGQLIGAKFLDCNTRHVWEHHANGMGGGGGGGFTGDPIGWDPGGGGYGGIPTGSGEYVPHEGDVFFRRVFDRTMEIQFPDWCLFYAMAYVNNELCRDTLGPGHFFHSYWSIFRYPPTQGADGRNVLSFLQAHFNTGMGTIILEHREIDAGRVVITDIAVAPGVTHAVVIVGYKQNGRLIYMDPLKGRLMEGHPRLFDQSFSFSAWGCK